MAGCWKEAGGVTTPNFNPKPFFKSLGIKQMLVECLFVVVILHLHFLLIK